MNLFFKNKEKYEVSRVHDFHYTLKENPAITLYDYKGFFHSTVEPTAYERAAMIKVIKGNAPDISNKEAIDMADLIVNRVQNALAGCFEVESVEVSE